MPTLMGINDTPPKADFLSPRNAKKSSASDEEIPSLASESNDELSDQKMSADRKVSAKSMDGKARSDSKGKSRKRSGRQISIFESIGLTPPTGKVLTPSTSTAVDTNADSTKKKKKRKTIHPKDDAFPICVHITAEGKEPKKVMITCHGLKSELNNEIVNSPIVLKEKRALPKDPVARFLGGFGRYIW
eukprot:scaffold8379_cov93-Skeletonema_dohrnii-CCMP3373.AAC.2